MLYHMAKVSCDVVRLSLLIVKSSSDLPKLISVDEIMLYDYKPGEF